MDQALHISYTFTLDNDDDDTEDGTDGDADDDDAPPNTQCIIYDCLEKRNHACTGFIFALLSNKKYTTTGLLM